MKCLYCQSGCKKAGKQTNGSQKYCCLSCGKYQQKKYVYRGSKQGITREIVRHVQRGCGIRDIAYLLEISTTTVIQRIRRVGKELKREEDFRPGLSYEMDELYTYIGRKSNPCWVMYVLERKSRRIVDFRVGSRTTFHLKDLVEGLKRFSVKRIYTDFLNIYPGIINSSIHRPGRYLTNYIERMNLTLRTHLKRLSRRSICYSKQKDMLENCLRIYFYSRSFCVRDGSESA